MDTVVWVGVCPSSEFRHRVRNDAAVDVRRLEELSIVAGVSIHLDAVRWQRAGCGPAPLHTRGWCSTSLVRLCRVGRSLTPVMAEHGKLAHIHGEPRVCSEARAQQGQTAQPWVCVMPHPDNHVHTRLSQWLRAHLEELQCEALASTLRQHIHVDASAMHHLDGEICALERAAQLLDIF